MVRWLMGLCWAVLVASCGSSAKAPPEVAAQRAVDGADTRALDVVQDDEVPMSADKRVALVIGNSAYETAGALQNPKNDARDLTVALMEVGFEVVEGYDLTASGMQDTLRRFNRALDGASVALFFYAGHGVQVDGRNYMLPIDAHLQRPEDLDFEAVDMNRVLVQLERQPRINMVILDACRNNPLADNLVSAMAGSSRAVGGRDAGLARLDAVAPNTLISFSTQPGATASDGVGRNSPFTKALLSQLRTPGLELQAMMRRVSAEVVRSSDGRQIPWQNSSLITDHYFVAPPDGADTPLAQAQDAAGRAEIELWLDVKDSGSVEELQAYVNRFPDGNFIDVANSRIKGLTLQGGADGTDETTLQASYGRLAKRGALVDDPKEPLEFYNNARVYELRGDSVSASKMYHRFVGFGLPYLDPHLGYQVHLKAQEGRMGAREAYQELAQAHPDDAVLAYAAALLQPPEQRLAQLTTYIEAHPEFGPALYDLSLEYSQQRRGTQTAADKRSEREYLQRYFAALEGGQVQPFYLDKLAADDRISEAETRLASLTGVLSGMVDNPVQFTANRHSAGWTIAVVISDVGYQDVLVEKRPGEFVSLGSMGMNHPMTGKPMPNTIYSMPPETEAGTIRFKYVDARGTTQGPFDFDLDPDSELKEGMRRNMKMLPLSAWVILQDNPGKPGQRLLYYTLLISYRCGLKAAHYGLDGTPDTAFALPPCDPTRPDEVPSDAQMYIDVPDTTTEVALQLTWFDGTKSDVVTARYR